MLSFNNGDLTGHGKMRTGVLSDLATGFSTLVDGASVTWDTENKKFPLAKLTSTQSFTIDITNAIDGQSGTLKLVTNTGSAITLTFDTTFTNKRLGVIGEESFTTYIFPAATGKEYLLSYILDGTTMHWIINETGMTAWTPTAGGFSAAPVFDAKYVYLIPKLIFIFVATPTLGTSNSTAAGGTTVTLPTGVLAASDLHLPAPRINNAGSQSAPGVASTTTGSNIITVWRDGTFATAWGTGGNKGFTFQGIIPVQ